MPETTDAPRFDAFALDARVRVAVDALGFESPTPIQREAIPVLLEGHDVIGRARTGSGKTAAFGLPLVHRVRDEKSTSALVLCPTRELALQVTAALRSYAKKLPVRIVTLYGGAPYGPQLRALKEGVSVVVGTPGRVLDHLDRGSLDLSAAQVLVLDEADEMLRMGFFDDVERVFEATPDECQIALFSATMPPRIRDIAVRRMKKPVEIQVEDAALTVSHIAQRYVEVPHRFKVDALVRILASEPPGAALVFARTRASCAQVADELVRRGLSSDALHGDLSQQARERVLARLRNKQLSVVVATDVAARGIDVEHLRLVVNFDLPDDPEQYVHRIGRTGRAGREGAAIAFITPREIGRLRRFERALDTRMERMQVPSDAVIASRTIDGLRNELDSLEPAATGAGVLDALLAGRTPEELARAALAILARERGLDPTAEPDARPPAWARGKSREDRGRDRKDGPREPRPRGGSDPQGGWVSLFMPTGRSSGTRPADVVGAIANELDVPSSQIGRITILDDRTFVELSSDQAERVLGERRELEVRGVSVPISLARPRTTPKGQGHAPSKRGERKGPKHRQGGAHPPKRWNRKKK